VVVPLTSDQVSLRIHLALREGIKKGLPTAHLGVPPAPSV
jgi:hypothetical protein